MQILINKSGRVVKLTKRERDLIDHAKQFVTELSTVTNGETADLSEQAADALGALQGALANKEHGAIAP